MLFTARRSIAEIPPLRGFARAAEFAKGKYVLLPFKPPFLRVVVDSDRETVGKTLNDKDLVKSKPWNWDLAKEEYWRIPSDELYPIAFRWKEMGYKKVLDLGCGVGRNSIFLSQLDFEVDAFDLSPSAIEELTDKIKEQKLKIRTKIGDMLELPYADEYFDSIVAFHSIYHTDMQGLQNVIREMKRVLIDGGEIFFTLNSKRSPSLKNPKNKIIDEQTILKTDGLEKDVPHTFVDYDDIKIMLEDFRIIKIQQIEDIFEDISSWHYFILVKK